MTPLRSSRSCRMEAGYFQGPKRSIMKSLKWYPWFCFAYCQFPSFFNACSKYLSSSAWRNFNFYPSSKRRSYYPFVVKYMLRTWASKVLLQNQDSRFLCLLSKSSFLPSLARSAFVFSSSFCFSRKLSSSFNASCLVFGECKRREEVETDLARNQAFILTQAYYKDHEVVVHF